MGDTDHEHSERAELERKFQQFARGNPDHPAVIRVIARRLATRKDGEPSECEKDWLGLALKEPNHPRVLAVRKAVENLAANRERHVKNRGKSVEQFRLQVQMEQAGTDSQQRHNVSKGASQSLATTVEGEKARLELFSPDDSDSHESNVEHVPPEPKSAEGSDRPYEKLSEEEKEAVLNDLKRYLHITKIFKRFADIQGGGDSKPN